MLRGPWGCRESDTPERTNHEAHLHQSRDHEPLRRAVILGSLTTVFPARGSPPVPVKPLAFSARGISSDGSFLSVGGEPALGPWGRRPPASCTAAAAPCWPQPREAGGEGNAGTQLPGARA